MGLVVVAFVRFDPKHGDSDETWESDKKINRYTHWNKHKHTHTRGYYNKRVGKSKRSWPPHPRPLPRALIPREEAVPSTQNANDAQT